MSVDWSAFTPWPALAGGALIGLAAAGLWLVNGRIAGISGILGQLLWPDDGERGWRLAFMAGLLLAPAVWALFAGSLPARPATPDNAGQWLALVGAGLLVGLGVKWANGCTSGHGVCGLARLSPRSLAAVVTFMATGFATVFVTRHLL